jgi:hypothetical protein
MGRPCGRGLEHEHLAADDLVAWGWHPREGRDPAPGSQQTLGGTRPLLDRLERAAPEGRFFGEVEVRNFSIRDETTGRQDSKLCIPNDGHQTPTLP